MVLTSFIGGTTDPEIAKKPKEEIAAIVQRDHQKILGITGSPIASAICVHHKALPQYNLGHAHIVQAIRDAEQSVSGLYFAGNYLEGPSIGKCVERGFQVGERVKAYLHSR
jgi:oxygen-dependent protoporphyrinogen oxidase